MTLRDWSRYDKNRYAETAKITRFATDELGSASDIYAAMKRPLVSRAASTLSGYILSRYRDTNPSWTDETNAQITITNGIVDIDNILFPFLSKRPSKESALAFLHHEHTTKMLGLTAIRDEGSLQELINRISTDPTTGSNMGESLVLPFSISAQSAGCPAAAVGKDMQPSKEFIGLTHLTGEVLIEALDHHGRFPDPRSN